MQEVSLAVGAQAALVVPQVGLQTPILRPSAMVAPDAMGAGQDCRRICHLGTNRLPLTDVGMPGAISVSPHDALLLGGSFFSIPKRNPCRIGPRGSDFQFGRSKTGSCAHSEEDHGCGSAPSN